MGTAGKPSDLQLFTTMATWCTACKGEMPQFRRLRAAFGSAGPVPTLVRAPLDEAASFPEQVASAASPIDDVRGTAAYRRHALQVLAQRALERCLA